MIPKKEVLDAEYDEREPWGTKIEHVCYFECPKCRDKIEVN